jgi:hypothetical protein
MCSNILFRGSFPPLLQSPINAGAFAMLAGLLIVPLVSLCTRAPLAQQIEAMFACYDRPVTVKAQESLGGPAEEKDRGA